MLTSTGVRTPRQARSQRTLERVLEVATDVLAQRGYEGLTISEVCRIAGTSAGALYTRFENKDALVRAVHDHAMAGLLVEVEARYADAPAWRELPTGEFVERAVRLLAEHFRDHAALVRALVLRSAVDPVMRASGAIAVRGMANAFTNRLLDRAADYPHPDPSAAVRDVFGAAFEAISWDIAFGGEFRDAGALGRPPDERLPEMCRLALLVPPD